MKTKYILSLVLSVCCSMSLLAQSSWLWAKADSTTAGTYDEGYGWAVSADTMGNVFVTGSFLSSAITFGSTVLTNSNPSGSTSDLFLAKYDASGNVLWAKNAGDSNNDASWGVSTDAAGNAFVTGSFSGIITFGSTTLLTSVTDVFLAKYDPNGNVLWAKSAAGASSAAGAAVCTDANGNVIITGYFTSPTITFGSIVLNNSSTCNPFIVKYDTNGNVLWAKNAGGTQQDASSSISADAAGNIYVTGYFQSPSITFGSTTLTNSNPGNAEVFIAKYDAYGNVLWAKNGAGTDGDHAISISADAMGNVFVTGYFSSPTIAFGSNTLTNAGIKNFFIVKYNAGGNVLWAKSAGGTNEDGGFSVSTDLYGNAFVTGYFKSPSITFGSTTLTPPAVSSEPMFILKYDINGNELCASALGSGGGNGVDQNAVSADRFGNAYISGNFILDPFIVGSDTLQHTGNREVFVAKYRCDNPATVNELSEEGNLLLYPNPSSGIFMLNSEITNGKISIYNILGEIIFQTNANSMISTIDLSNEPNGIYFVNVQTEKKSFTQKIIVQK